MPATGLSPSLAQKNFFLGDAVPAFFIQAARSNGSKGDLLTHYNSPRKRMGSTSSRPQKDKAPWENTDYAPTFPGDFKCGLKTSHFPRRYYGNRFCFLFLPLMICLSSGCVLTKLRLEWKKKRVNLFLKICNDDLPSKKFAGNSSLFSEKDFHKREKKISPEIKGRLF